MQKISLYDFLTIKIVEEEGVSLTCDDPSLPTDRSNLVVKAALAFMAKSRVLLGCGLQIALQKNIPVAAGLGGGSSDAGTMLLGLNRLCGDEFNEQELIQMATPLGADVPFFACMSGAAIAEGIGEILEAVPSNPDYGYVLVNPGFDISTKEIFENFSLTSVDDQDILLRPVREDFLSFNIGMLHNDLEPVTCAMRPIISGIKKDLQEAGASGTLMAGSGPTVFGVFEDGLTVEKFNHIYEALSPIYGDKIFIAKAI